MQPSIAKLIGISGLSLAFAVFVLLNIAGAEFARADPPLFSLLAVGDTGADPDDPERYRTQLAVGVAMAANDRADSVVLPGVETCRSCHKPGGAPSTCVTCHAFHPR